MKQFIFIVFCIFFIGCGSNSSNTVTEKSLEGKVTQESTEDKETNTQKYNIYKMSDSPSFPDASLTNMRYKTGKFSFDVQGDSYSLGSQTTDAKTKMCANSSKGQHIHLIVDNKPYAAKYTADFDYDVEDGEHHLLAFLSRSYHESIKTSTSYIAEKISVKDKTIQAAKPIKDPMLFYSRPKGTYIGEDGKKIMLDFFLLNTEIGPKGNKVIATINGEQHTLSTWQPYIIENLPLGENTIELLLVDMHGKKINTPLNPVTRTFTIAKGLEE